MGDAARALNGSLVSAAHRPSSLEPLQLNSAERVSTAVATSPSCDDDSVVAVEPGQDAFQYVAGRGQFTIGPHADGSLIVTVIQHGSPMVSNVAPVRSE